MKLLLTHYNTWSKVGVQELKNLCHNHGKLLEKNIFGPKTYWLKQNYSHKSEKLFYSSDEKVGHYQRQKNERLCLSWDKNKFENKKQFLLRDLRESLIDLSHCSTPCLDSPLCEAELGHIQCIRCVKYWDLTCVSMMHLYNIYLCDQSQTWEWPWQRSLQH